MVNSNTTIIPIFKGETLKALVGEQCELDYRLHKSYKRWIITSLISRFHHPCSSSVLADENIDPL